MLDSIQRAGMTTRPMLERALGIDPNNILQRLLGRKQITSVAGLPDNRSYYVAAPDRPLGSKALQQRLALAWFIYMDRTRPRIALTPTEVRLLLGDDAPVVPHVLEGGERPRVVSIYAPDTNEVTNALAKQVAQAQRNPLLAASIANGTYAWALLLPWTSNLLAPFTAKGAPGTSEERRIDRLLGTDPRLRGAPILAHQVASPETLTLALKASTGGTG
ncbi:MAG: hypothetical protein U1F36_22505 [Planctomycetota bacterium]